MAPKRWLASARSIPALVALATLAAASSAHAIRLMDYNVLNYPGTTGAARDPYFRTVIQPVDPDIFVAEEMLSQSGVNEFLNNLNTMQPGEWAALPFVDGNDTDCALFYKPAKVAALGQWFFYPNPANLLRLVHVYRIRPVGYASNAADIRLYVMHLKASTGFESQRLAEATGLRDSMNAMPSGTHGFALGDFNFYTGTEPGLLKLLENQADNDGRLYDPLGLQNINWQDNTGIQYAWTQSPCKTGDSGCANGASTGGIDDRFDLILPTLNWNGSQGYGLVAGSYKSVGNDGLHHNNSIQDPPTIPEGAAYATALHTISDHLPVRVDLRLPARISTPAALAFGSVIVGGTASQNLAVLNPAVPPADGLDYSMVAPAGFSAPGGAFNVAAGAPAASHVIDMDTGTSGVKSGSLAITSDNADSATTSVPLSGTVLEHAQASLDSSAIEVAQTLDFGSHAEDEFATLMARVHDAGYDALRARLAVSSGTIVGGDGRFSIVDGFSQKLVAQTAQTYTVEFDPVGATQDLDYDATLTFSGADEPLSGATAQPDLVVSLHAKVVSGTAGVPGQGLPKALTFYPPRPNPISRDALFAYDLPAAAPVSLAIFDLSGRRVASLVSGTQEPDRHQVRWNTITDAGERAPAGLYFARFSTPGMSRVSRLIVLP